jgi:predicted phage terminase large subunit-like protein
MLQKSKDLSWNKMQVTLGARTSQDKDPTIIVKSVRSGFTGKHFDLIIADDIVTLGNSQTPEKRKKLLSWFRSTVEPTLEPEGEFRVIGTRYYIDDLYANLCGKAKNKDTGEDEFLDENFGPNTLVIPALMIRDALDVETGGVKDEYYSFWEDRFPVEKLLKWQKTDLESFNLSRQNVVIGLNSGIFKAHSIYDNLYPEPQPLPDFDQSFLYFQGVDTSVSIKTSSDYFCSVVIAVNKFTKQTYVIDVFKRKGMTAEQQINTILAQASKYNCLATYIEEVSSSAHLIQFARSKSITTNLEGVKIGTTDKVARAKAGSMFFDQNLVSLRRTMATEINELLNFPNVPNDDFTDALVLAVINSQKFFIESRPNFSPISIQLSLLLQKK